jgi:hypothetical protein
VNRYVLVKTYVLGSQNLTTQGLYTETFISALGCDSTVNLDLTVLPVFTSNTSEIGCGSYTSPSGNYTWTASGTYNDTIPSIQNGCDSVLVIDLTIADTSLIEYWTMACDQFIFEGNTYNQGGIYDVVYPNQFGCDSTLRLHLQITPTPSTPITSGDQELCDGRYTNRHNNRTGELNGTNYLRRSRRSTPWWSAETCRILCH